MPGYFVVLTCIIVAIDISVLSLLVHSISYLHTHVSRLEQRVALQNQIAVLEAQWLVVQRERRLSGIAIDPSC